MHQSPADKNHFRGDRPKHHYFLCTSIVLALLVVACSVEDSEDERAILGAFTETLHLGTYDGDGTELDLFGSITEVAVDRAGNIYVADVQSQEVRVFDAHGNGVGSFGERGQAPAEFQAITAMIVDDNERLIVADPENARISILDTNGTLLESHQSPIAGPIRQIRKLPGGQFLLVGLHNEHLVHIVDARFQHVLAHLVPISDITYTEDRLEEMWLQLAPGFVVAFSDNQVLYAPSVYGGRLYVYEREDENTWGLARPIDVYSPDGAPLTISDDGDGAAFSAPMPTPDGRFVVRGLHLQSVTSGLDALNDGRAIHVFSRETEDGVIFLAGIMSPDGTYEGDFIAQDRSYEDHLALQTNEVDANNYMYQVDTHDYPVLRRMNISFDE